MGLVPVSCVLGAVCRVTFTTHTQQGKDPRGIDGILLSFVVRELIEFMGLP
jgi:hypothetical protein